MLTRLRHLLTQPRAEWARIGAEAESGWAVLLRWVLPLALLTVAGGLLRFLLWTVIMGADAGWHMAPFALRSVGGQVLGVFVAIIVIGGIAAAYAPTFHGRRDWGAGCRVVAFASLPALLAGALAFFPFAWVLGLAGLLWSIWLLSEGLAPVMKSDPTKRVPYTAAVVLTAIAIFLLLTLWPSCRRLGEVTFASPPTATDEKPQAAKSSGGAGGKSKEAGKRERDEKAPAGELVIDQEALARARELLKENAKSTERRKMEEGVKRAVETADRLAAKSAPPSALAALLPETALGLARRSGQSSLSPLKGVEFAEAKASYGGNPGEPRIQLEIGDRTVHATALTQLRRLVTERNQQTPRGFNRLRTEGDHYIQEVWDEGAKNGTFTVLIENRFTVRAVVSGAADPELAAKAARLIDWQALAKLKDAATQ